MDKGNLLAPADKHLKRSFYFMLGVPPHTNTGFTAKLSYLTQTQTNLRPRASDGAWLTRCNTFSSDLSLIENGRRRFCVPVLQLPLLCDTEKGKSKCRETSQPLPFDSESIPRLLFAPRDRESSSDSSG